MITMQQAHDVVSATSYRNWRIRPVGQTTLDTLLRTPADRVYVRVDYTVPDSDNPMSTFDNAFVFSFPLPQTEAEVARAIFEAITVVEDHERREFFKVGSGVVRDRQGDGRNAAALFHPHGFNRNKMFHDLDPYAGQVRKELMAYGQPFTADAA